MNRKLKGRIGEEKAARFLEEWDYKIIKRNFRSRVGEIDIVAGLGDEIVFVEVKNWDGLGMPELGHSISHKKRRRILNTARYFLSQNPQFLESRLRFDVILLSENLSRIEHIVNAFGGD